MVAAWPQPLSRDRAMGLLWPERDVANARRLLNLAVHVLRSALGEGAIASTGDGLLLIPTLVRCDLHDLRAAIAAGESERVVRLYTGTLLEGFHLDDSTEFGYWLDEHRTELAHAYIGALLAFASAQDPTFALAFAHVAMAYTELAEGGAMAPDVAYERAARAVAKALELDPDLGAAHCTLGHLKTARELDCEGAEREFRRAIELSPSGAEAYDLYGRLCTGLERYDDSLALLRRAQELDPLAHGLDIVTALLRAGRYDEAVARAEDAVAVYDAQDRARATLGWAYFLSGRKQEGLAELERAVELSPNNMLWLSQLGAAYARAGDHASARATLRDLEARAENTYVSPYHFAYVYTGLGHDERAIDWLERAVAERAGPVFGLRGSFLFASLHAHPRFRSLLRQLKLA
jgi:tetratricopeptide (TPR) repeat protein